MHKLIYSVGRGVEALFSRLFTLIVEIVNLMIIFANKFHELKPPAARNQTYLRLLKAYVFQIQKFINLAKYVSILLSQRNKGFT